MKRIMQALAMTIVLMLMSAPAWAYDELDHVSQAPNGKGDVLIFPFYMVLDGSFQTRVQVINTSDEMSAVAKVVLRSPVLSQEVRDFFIILSPTDMWEGTVKMDNGQIVIYSEDDSTLTSTQPTFATETDPFRHELVNPGCDDTTEFGYAEVFLTRVFNEDIDDVNLTKARVDKEDIYEYYIGPGDIMEPSLDYGLTPNSALNEEVDINILSGHSYIESPIAGWSAALNPTVLKDYGLDVAAGLFETNLGVGANNSIVEVEAALSKNSIAMPYDNTDFDTLHLFNFPTKQPTLEECAIDTLLGEYEGFKEGALKGVQVSVLGFDMEERTRPDEIDVVSPFEPGEARTLDMEVSFRVPSTFDKGWYRYSMFDGPTTGLAADNATEITYHGAPVIPFALNFSDQGFNMHYGSWTDGTVKANLENEDEVLGGYQYVRGYAYTAGMED